MLFDFLKQNTIPAVKDVKHIEFTTASPAVSASNYWVVVNQQIRHYMVSTVDLKRNQDTISGILENIKNISLKLSELEFEHQPVIQIGKQIIQAEKGRDISLAFNNGLWLISAPPDPKEKHPARYGGFKLAFTNQMVFVYATGGKPEENELYQNKARYDAETFLYRGNGSIEIVADIDFSLSAFADRNVILYGNADNNKAWNLLLKDAPVKVEPGVIHFGPYSLRGNDLGTYFMYPRPDSETASVCVVAGTGLEGMKALAPNDYFSGITGFPDLLIFSTEWLRSGMEGIRVSGFFGNDWSIDQGDFRMN